MSYREVDPPGRGADWIRVRRQPPVEIPEDKRKQLEAITRRQIRAALRRRHGTG